MAAGAKGGGGKKSTPPGVNPFASSDLMALRNQLPSKPELTKTNTKPGDGGEMVRLSEAEAIAALGGEEGATTIDDRAGGGSRRGGRRGNMIACVCVCVRVCVYADIHAHPRSSSKANRKTTTGEPKRTWLGSQIHTFERQGTPSSTQLQPRPVGANDPAELSTVGEKANGASAHLPRTRLASHVLTLRTIQQSALIEPVSKKNK